MDTIDGGARGPRSLRGLIPVERGGASGVGIAEIVETRVYGLAAFCAAAGISRTALQRYRKAGIVAPLRGAPASAPAARVARDGGMVFDEDALRRARTARRLIRDLGVNLAGAGVTLRLLDELASARAELDAARALIRLMEPGATGAGRRAVS